MGAYIDGTNTVYIRDRREATDGTLEAPTGYESHRTNRIHMNEVYDRFMAGRFKPGDYLFRTDEEGYRWKLRIIGVMHRGFCVQARPLEKYKVSGGSREFQRFPINRFGDEYYTYDSFKEDEHNWGYSIPSKVRLKFDIGADGRDLTIKGNPPYEHFNV